MSEWAEPGARSAGTREISRRACLSLLAAAAVWPLAARAQQSDRMRRIGVLLGVPRENVEFKSALATLTGGDAAAASLVLDDACSALSRGASVARAAAAVAGDDGRYP